MAVAARPALVAIRIIGLRSQRKRMALLGNPTLLRTLSPGISRRRPAIKFWLLMAAIALMVVMIARPQTGSSISHEKRQGIQTMICLDISNSMMAQDVAPSRLEKSKIVVEDLVDHFRNDQIGMVVFAGDAFIQLPITSDYVSAKLFLQDIDPSLIGTQGTDMAQAIRLAMQSFAKNGKQGKAIIVITDGENHEGGAEAMAKEAEKQGIRVFILGIGTAAGAPIPPGDGGYMKDAAGQVVMTRLNETMCQEVAKAGKGVYMHVDNSLIAERQLDKELQKMQQGAIDNVVYSDYDEQFQGVAILILILLIAEAVILEKKREKEGAGGLINRKKNETDGSYTHRAPRGHAASVRTGRPPTGKAGQPALPTGQLSAGGTLLPQGDSGSAGQRHGPLQPRLRAAKAEEGPAGPRTIQAGGQDDQRTEATVAGLLQHGYGAAGTEGVCQGDGSLQERLAHESAERTRTLQLRAV